MKEMIGKGRSPARLKVLAVAILTVSIASVARAQAPGNPFDFARMHSFTYNVDGSVHTDTVEIGRAHV